jgi:hypothetical protein
MCLNCILGVTSPQSMLCKIIKDRKYVVLIFKFLAKYWGKGIVNYPLGDIKFNIALYCMMLKYLQCTLIVIVQSKAIISGNILWILVKMTLCIFCHHSQRKHKRNTKNAFLQRRNEARWYKCNNKHIVESIFVYVYFTLKLGSLHMLHSFR